MKACLKRLLRWKRKTSAAANLDNSVFFSLYLNVLRSPCPKSNATYQCVACEWQEDLHLSNGTRVYVRTPPLSSGPLMRIMIMGTLVTCGVTFTTSSTLRATDQARTDRVRPLRLSSYAHYTTSCLQRLYEHQHQSLNHLAGHLVVRASVGFRSYCSLQRVPKGYRESSISSRIQEGDSPVPNNKPILYAVTTARLSKMRRDE